MYIPECGTLFTLAKSVQNVRSIGKGKVGSMKFESKFKKQKPKHIFGENWGSLEILKRKFKNVKFLKYKNDVCIRVLQRKRTNRMCIPRERYLF